MKLANVIGASGFRVHNGMPLQIIEYPEGSAQAFGPGEIVTLSSGLVVRAMTAHATSNLTTQTILGRPLMAATGVARTNIPVAIVNDFTDISMPVWHTSDTGTNVRLREALNGAKFPIGNRTANQPDANAQNEANTWVVDTASGGTNDKCTVVELGGYSPVSVQVIPGKQGVPWNTTEGEKYGHMWVKIIAAQRTLG